MAGIERLKKLIVTAVKFVEWLFKSLADHKVDITEWFGLLGLVPGTFETIAHAPELVAEAKDLDADEIAQLKQTFVETFDLDNEPLESDIEEITDGLSLMGQGAMKIYKTIATMKARGLAGSVRP